jgi:S1-C subfamily serine protease
VLTFDKTPGARITTVLADSTAQEAGIRVGDVIVEIDGRDVLNASHETVLGLLKSSAASVRLYPCSYPSVCVCVCVLGLSHWVRAAL